MRNQRGFTILELMVVVAIIAILATVAVPAWFRDSSKAKAKSEVSAMFAELSTKEEQFMIDQSTYYPWPANTTAACPAVRMSWYSR